MAPKGAIKKQAVKRALPKTKTKTTPTTSSSISKIPQTQKLEQVEADDPQSLEAASSSAETAIAAADSVNATPSSVVVAVTIREVNLESGSSITETMAVEPAINEIAGKVPPGDENPVRLEVSAEKPAAKAKAKVIRKVKVIKKVIRKRPKAQQQPEDGNPREAGLEEKAKEEKLDAKEEEEAKTKTREEFYVDEFQIAEERKKRRTEIFVGGLDRDAKEEDVRKVFEKVGEILEVRVIKNSQTGKNKGYGFVRYKRRDEAQKALRELDKAEICGKPCNAVPLEHNDTIFLGNIDKKWKKEDVLQLLKDIGIENIHTVYLMMDPSNPKYNRGFAFLDLETNKDAHAAYKKLQTKDVFGKGRNIKVSWAEPLNDPGEEEMIKVKSVYVSGIPSSWNEGKMTKIFSKFGDIDRVRLAKDMPNTKRQDFAFVNYKSRDAALSCIETINKEGLEENGFKINIKATLAKPVNKEKKVKTVSKFIPKEHPKPASMEYDKVMPKEYSKATTKGHPRSTFKEPKDKVREFHRQKPRDVYQRPSQSILYANKGTFIDKGAAPYVDNRSSTTQELLKVLREQAAQKQGPSGFGSASASDSYVSGLGKRPYPSLVDDSVYSDSRGYPRPRVDSTYPIPSSSYSSFSHGASASLPSYSQKPLGYDAGSSHAASPSDYFPVKTRYGNDPYGSGPSYRY